MEARIDRCLEKLAKLRKLTQQKDGSYVGPHGTVFYKTAFGFLTYTQLPDHLKSQIAR